MNVILCRILFNDEKSGMGKLTLVIYRVERVLRKWRYNEMKGTLSLQENPIEKYFWAGEMQMIFPVWVKLLISSYSHWWLGWLVWVVISFVYSFNPFFFAIYSPSLFSPPLTFFLSFFSSYFITFCRENSTPKTRIHGVITLINYSPSPEKS